MKWIVLLFIGIFGIDGAGSDALYDQVSLNDHAALLDPVASADPYDSPGDAAPVDPDAWSDIAASSEHAASYHLAASSDPIDIVLKLCSWNLKDFGSSKSDETILFIAETLRDFDIVLIQEVVAGPGGPQAVAKLNDELNRKGAKWDYVVSDPTTGSAYKVERYAVLWKPSKVKKIGRSWLEEKYKMEIDREPFYSTFAVDSKEFTLVNFHAITKSQQPETEVKYFKFLPAQYPELKLIFCGDFNLPEKHSVFNPLKKMGYLPVLTNQKTSLKQKSVNGQMLASEFDNVFYLPANVTRKSSGVIHFYQQFADLEEARKVSDHVPVIFEFVVKI